MWRRSVVVPGTVTSGGGDVRPTQRVEHRDHRWDRRRPFHRVDQLQRRTSGSGRDAVPTVEGLTDLDDSRDRQVARGKPCSDPITFEVLDMMSEADHQLAAVESEAEASRPGAICHVLDLPRM